MRRSRLNTGASVVSAVSALSATSAASGLSLTSGASPQSVSSSHSNLSIPMGGNSARIGVSNHFGKETLHKNPRCVVVCGAILKISESILTAMCASDSSSAAGGESGPPANAACSKTLSFPVPDKIDSPSQANPQNNHRNNFGLNIGKF